ncbi:MAG TPA: rRNA maturation RNase YbeY [Rickettsiales bacterium]|nr:rRNA maturation RNase YbeY [Rickettsiales bacterium]
MPDGSSKKPAGRRQATSPAAEINIQRISGEWSRAVPGYKWQIELWCREALGKKSGVLSVVLADDAFVQGLNHQYRGKDKPTNVLSFPGEGEELGDIVLAFETLKREAKEQKKSFRAHCAHLVVHGVLHLLGHDHENDKDAARMEAQEIAMLAKLGFSNPYEVA